MKRNLCSFAALLLALIPSADCDSAQKGAYPVVAPSTDFSRYGKKLPWAPTRELVDKLTAKRPSINYEEAKVRPYTLPDILTLADGRKVTTMAVWEQQRRGELLDLFRREIYGFAPPKPESLSFQVVESNPQAMNGQATLKRVAIRFQLQGEPFTFHLTLFVPIQRKDRAPVFLLLNHRGPENTDPTRMVKSEFWPAEYVIGRGYAVAAVNVAVEVEPDSAKATNGVRLFYRQHGANPDKVNWGALSAWAWSGSRAVDYLETDRDINASQIAVVGHSRGGKTSLWAGAQDTRFALVCVNDSGCTGSSLSKRNLGEDVAALNKSFPHWTTAKYKTYDHQEDRLPVDQHELVALVAPRALHDGESAEDLWADPRGSWLALVEASSVWSMHGKAAAMKDAMPLVNDLHLNGSLAFHIREGGHGLTMFDWKLYLDHADTLFKKANR
jgi:hypothetical protein